MHLLSTEDSIHTQHNMLIRVCYVVMLSTEDEYWLILLSGYI